MLTPLGCGGAGLGAEKSAQQNHGPSKLDLALEEFWSWPASLNAPTFDGVLVKQVFITVSSSSSSSSSQLTTYKINLTAGPANTHVKKYYSILNFRNVLPVLDQ